MHFLKPFLISALLATGLLSACETTPPDPVEMDPAVFSQQFMRAQTSGSILHIDRLLQNLLAYPFLSDQQEVQVRRLRATRKKALQFDYPGAIADYQAVLSLSPESPDRAQIEANIRFLQQEIISIEERRAGLQTLQDWFDDTIRMGELERAASRQRQSRLSPTPAQIYLLTEAGYICPPGGGVQPVHQFSPASAETADLVWCQAATS